MRIVVYDMLGREVAVVVDKEHRAGRHTAVFPVAGLSSGVYVVRMTAAGGSETWRVTAVR